MRSPGEVRNPRLLLCSDVDGTLLDEDSGKLFPSADELSRSARRAGFFGLASARPFGAMTSLSKELGEADFISALQGADIRVPPHNSELSSNVAIDRSSAAQLMDYAERGRHEVWAYTREGWFVSSISATVEREIDLVGLQPNGLLAGVGTESVLKVVLVGTARVSRTVHRLLRSNLLYAARSTPIYTEVVSSRAPRGKGLGTLVDWFNRENSVAAVAIGNGYNDREMLRSADVGCTFEDSVLANDPSNIVLPRACDGGLLVLASALDATRASWSDHWTTDELLSQLTSNLLDG